MVIDGHNVAGNGTTALGIIGTVLGGAALAMNGTNGVLNLTGSQNKSATSFENTPTCMHDLDVARELAEKDAKIAKLESDMHTDAAKASMKDYTDRAVIDVYRELKADINGIKSDNAATTAAQAVVNANLSGAITTLQGQVTSTASLVAGITKTAVPKSAICNFGCSGCGND